MAYVVRTPGSELTEEQVIQFVAIQVDLTSSKLLRFRSSDPVK